VKVFTLKDFAMKGIQKGRRALHSRNKLARNDRLSEAAERRRRPRKKEAFFESKSATRKKRKTARTRRKSAFSASGDDLLREEGEARSQEKTTQARPDL